MIRAVFEWREDREMGDWGWIMKGQPEFNAVHSGRTLAHDVLEHFRPSGLGPVADEALAMGSLIHIRAFSGMLMDSNERAIGYELARLFESMASGSGYENLNVKLQALRGDNREVEELIQESIRFGWKHAEIYDGEDPMEDRRVKAAVAGWMRLGYRKCLRRYHRANSGQVSSLFYRLEQDAERYVKRGREGDTLVVQVNTQKLTCRVRHVERWEMYE